MSESERSDPSALGAFAVIALVCLVDATTYVYHAGVCEAGENQSEAYLRYCTGSTPRIALYAAGVVITLGLAAWVAQRQRLMYLAFLVGLVGAAVVWIAGMPD